MPELLPYASNMPVIAGLTQCVVLVSREYVWHSCSAGRVVVSAASKETMPRCTLLFVTSVWATSVSHMCAARVMIVLTVVDFLAVSTVMVQTTALKKCNDPPNSTDHEQSNNPPDGQPVTTNSA